MFEGSQWFVSHLKSEHAIFASQLPLNEFLARVEHQVTPRPPWQDEAYFTLSGRTKSLPEDQFTVFLSDFDARGAVAIRSRGLWGRVQGSRFSFEIATGYGAQRWWIPRVKASVSASDEGGTDIKYRLIVIQLRQRVAWIVALGIGFLATFFGMSLLVSASSIMGGVVTLAVGVIIITALMNRMGVLSSVADQMAENLILRIEQIARIE